MPAPLMKSTTVHGLPARAPLAIGLHTAITLALLTTAAAALYGHWDGSATGLSLVRSYVTEYIKQSPHWPWLVVAAFSFALLLQLIAFAFLLQPGRSWLIRAGCLMLASSSMATFFAAYSPMRRVPQPPPPARQWWTPSWWFTSKAAQSPYETGLADAYSDVHYRATRLVVVTVVAGVFCLGFGHLADPHSRRFALSSIAAAAVMSLFFLLGDRLETFRGLWQRIGFLALFAWLCLARSACHRLPPAHPSSPS